MASRPVSRILWTQRSYPRRAGDHLSGIAVAGNLVQPTRTSDGTSSPVGCPKTTFRPAWPCSWWGLPGRRHCCRRRWSLTPPFHPRRKSRPFRQCTSLLHVPSSCPARPLAGTTLWGVRTFLSLGEPKPRSPGQLATFNHTEDGALRQPRSSGRALFIRKDNAASAFLPTLADATACRPG